MSKNIPDALRRAVAKSVRTIVVNIVGVQKLMHLFVINQTISSAENTAAKRF
jgi:hypothetical protein